MAHLLGGSRAAWSAAMYGGKIRVVGYVSDCSESQIYDALDNVPITRASNLNTLSKISSERPNIVQTSHYLMPSWRWIDSLRLELTTSTKSEAIAVGHRLTVNSICKIATERPLVRVIDHSDQSRCQSVTPWLATRMIIWLRSPYFFARGTSSTPSIIHYTQK